MSERHPRSSAQGKLSKKAEGPAQIMMSDSSATPAELYLKLSTFYDSNLISLFRLRFPMLEGSQGLNEAAPCGTAVFCFTVAPELVSVPPVAEKP